MKEPRGHAWPVLTILAMLVLIWSGAAKAEQTLYKVEGGPVRLQVERSAMLETPSVGSTSAFTLARIVEDDTTLYYSLSALVNELGHAFPGDMLVVKTHYDSDWQAFTSQHGLWSSFDDQISLLDAHALSSEILVGLKGNADAWAGTYRGLLSSKQGPDIPIEVVVPLYTVASLEPDTVHVAVDHGPDWYDLEPLEVRVDANHANWVVTLSSAGLFYQGDKYDDVPPMQLYLAGEEEPLSEKGYVIARSGQNLGNLFTIKLKTEASWKHPAGRYEGTIIASVHGNE